MVVVTAGALAIGDELLSGRTRDSNIHYLAGRLTALGVRLEEARFTPDDVDAIANALNAMRARWDYVFTSGGIGPTHDDITVDAVAKAFDVSVVEDPNALAALERWYAARGETVTAARRRMARAPSGAALIDNSASGAPGFHIANVFVMAGVPRVFEAMLAAVEPRLRRGARLEAHAVTAQDLPESQIAEALREVQTAFPAVRLGSYPIDADVKGVTVVARAEEAAAAGAAIDAVADAMRALGAAPRRHDHRDPPGKNSAC